MKTYKIIVDTTASEIYRLTGRLQKHGKVLAYSDNEIYFEVDNKGLHKAKVLLTHYLGSSDFYSVEELGKVNWKPVEWFERVFVDKPALWLFILGLLHEYGDNAEITWNNILNYVEEKTGLKPRKFTLKWSIFMLKRAKLISEPRKGTYRITDKGRAVYFRALKHLREILDKMP